MIQRMLVPTDDSPLSDRAVPIAEVVAAAQNAEVSLLQVIPPPVWAAMGDDGSGSIVSNSPELYQQVLDAEDEEARRNLARLTQRLESFTPPIRTRTALFNGSPAAALLDYEREWQPDLVVMASHGRTGLARFALGSIADRLVREGTAPVLLVRSFGPEVRVVDRALVPLDDSALAAEALLMVEALAGRPLKQVHLVRVISLPEEAATAHADLLATATRLRAAGLQVESAVREGQPAETIAALAGTVDLVIMATHGRGGWNRLRHGSVAEHLLREVPVPVLLVRAGQHEEAASGNQGMAQS